MATNDVEFIQTAVRERYGEAARSAESSCCGPSVPPSGTFGSSLYADSDRDLLPAEALVASLGCGNPTMLAQLHPGDVVLDLGSGGGIDVLLSAQRVGPDGMAYGLDMTPEMHDLAQRNQARAGVTNAEFLFGTIENIPLPDNSVDVIISNCVVNLAADKTAVFAEANRVLRPGGRFAISDMVLSRELPEPLSGLMSLWTGCVAGALVEDDCAAKLAAAGFEDISITPTNIFGKDQLMSLSSQINPADIPSDLDVQEVIAELDGVIRSAFIRARTAR